MTPFDELFAERVIFIGTPIDETCANDVVAQLFTLESLDPDREISVYLNSPGGSHTAMTAIYDTMRFVRCDVRTVCVGQAAGPAALLLAAGAKSGRAVLPHARVVIRQPAAEAAYGQASDLQIEAGELLRTRDELTALLARHTGRPVEEVRHDLDRDRYLTAEDARAYGLADEVISGRAPLPVQSLAA